MTASKSFGFIILPALVSGSATSGIHAAEFAWQPITAGGSHTLAGNEIILDGGGQRVYLELKLSGWGAAVGLRTWQAVLDPVPLGQVCVGGGNDGDACFTGIDCFGGGVCTPTRPGPIVAAVEACAADAECTTAFNEDGAMCDSAGAQCFAGWQNYNRSDFVIRTGIGAVDTRTPDFRFGSDALFGPPAVDDGSIFYGGHLALDVPSNASGSYLIGFVPGAYTAMVNELGFGIAPIVLTDATITVGLPPGACCDTAPGAGGACADDVPLRECSGTYNEWTVDTDCAEAPACDEISGACCNGLNGTCAQCLILECQGQSQVWVEDESCAQIDCSADLGACCDAANPDPLAPEGVCTNGTLLADCQGENRTWHKGAACLSVTCDVDDRAIPTVSEWGLALLAMTILILAKLIFGRRANLA